MSPFPENSFANTKRKFGRVRCRQIGCSIGVVLDLSAGGMRIRSHGAMGLHDGDTVGLTLSAGAGPIPLPCKIVWMRKSGWRNWEMGLSFLELAPDARTALNGVARGVTFQGEVTPAGL